MKTLAIAALSFAGSLYAADLKTDLDKISYSIGARTAQNLQNQMKDQKVELNKDIFNSAVIDQLTDKKLKLTDKEITDSILKFQEQQMAKAKAEEKAISDKNKQEAKDFLEKNKKRKNVVTLDSGLQYEILEKGKGKSPKAEDTVVAHYKGTLLDGTEFDSSYKRNEPATFQVNRLIPGWQEALQLMQPGAKWKLYIPSDLAYGRQGAGNIITPNSMLIFDLELLEIKQS